MDLTLRIFLFALSVLFLAFVLLRIRRGRYLLKYSLIWIVLSVIGVVSAIFPNWIYEVSYLLGFAAPSNFVYFALIGFLLITNVIFGGILSKQENMLKSLVQEVSILKSVNDEQGGQGKEHVEAPDEDVA